VLMQEIKTYFKGAPFYNAFLMTYPRTFKEYRHLWCLARFTT
jgi:hypothetical protein